MADAGEIKAKVTIEYDGSGVDQAKEDLASLGDMAGSFSGASGLGDAVSGLGDQLAEATKALVPFADAAGGIAEPLTTGETAVSEFTNALGEHQQALLDAGSAYQALQEPLGSTVSLLQEAAPSMATLTEHAQSMSEQMGNAGDGFTQIQESLSQAVPMLPQFADNLHTVEGSIAATSQAMDGSQESTRAFTEQYNSLADAVSTVDQSFQGSQIFTPETIKSNMAAFSEAINSPDVLDPIAHLQGYLDQTGQSWEGFTSTIGDGRMNALYDMVDQFGGTYQALGNVDEGFQQAGKSANTFTGNMQSTQAAMSEFNQADPWTNFNAGAGNANEAIAGVQEGINKFGGVGNAAYGPELPPLSTYGLFNADGLDSISAAGMALDSFMRPLMYVQQGAMMVGQLATGIYTMAAIAEGPGAHGMNTFTGSVDSFNQVAQQTGQTFSEGFGNSFKTTLDAIDNTAAQSGGSGGIGGIGSFLGGVTGGIADTFETLGGLSQMIGSGVLNVLSGGNTGFYGASTFQAGIHGFTNLYDQSTGQAEQYPNTIAPDQYGAQSRTNIQTAVGQSNLSSVQLAQEANNPQYLQSQNQSSAFSGYEQQYQAAYNAQHPVTLQDFQAAMKTQADIGYQQIIATQYGITTQQAVAAGIVAPMSTLPPGEAVRISGGNAPATYGQGTMSQSPGVLQQVASFLTGGNLLTGLGPSNPLQEWGAQAGNWTAGALGGAGNFLQTAPMGLMSGIDSFMQNPFGMGQQPLTTAGCFPAGTSVLMADGREQAIETLQIGDEVCAHDGIKQITTTVLARHMPPPRQVYELTFSNGKTLTLTNSHPIATPLQGWKSLSPSATKQENPDLVVTALQIGDTVCTVDGICTLVTVQSRDVVQVYNITVDDPHTFYANGVLVHNKGESMTASGTGTESVSLAHTFTADVTWEANDLQKQFTAVAQWAEQGVQHAVTAVAQWAEQGVQHAVTAVANWAEQGVSHAVTAVANWAEENTQHAIQAVAQWTEQNVIHPVVAAAQWTEQNIVKPIVAAAQWTVNGAEKLITAAASWAGENLTHLFTGVAQWAGENLTHLFTAVATYAAPVMAMMAEGTENYAGGPAIVGEAGPEVVAANGGFSLFDQGATFIDLPSGASVYPLQSMASSSPSMYADGTGGGPPLVLSMGGQASGPQVINFYVNLDSQSMITALGLPLAANMRVSTGMRGY